MKVKIQWGTLEEDNTFKYLGATMSAEGSSNEEIWVRIGLAIAGIGPTAMLDLALKPTTTLLLQKVTLSYAITLCSPHRHTAVKAEL